jgi:hypothetical protein
MKLPITAIGSHPELVKRVLKLERALNEIAKWKPKPDKAAQIAKEALNG